ncbi:uncharacterized protein F4807DRAFT_436634 [Annulohypoxylon truncatum]|uniref:uncharacterized protein n=1 Tax=Annulohypoxylon truncatum TaxID=327061 RepID=UPI00200765C3|nr:uncharacterized protein F4807DRAFT_436634 [Annulohypoxylon truncatum]KAI1207000.1 hypothetical protein F4807DRAFT_436634 [Annulohypoxylon truncatum]
MHSLSVQLGLASLSYVSFFLSSYPGPGYIILHLILHCYERWNSTIAFHPYDYRMQCTLVVWIFDIGYSTRRLNYVELGLGTIG